ncbi:MAG: hypothetical protein ABI091_08050, partial [Ferruginibacter sp.]
YMYFTEASLVFLSMKLNVGYAAVILIQLFINLYALIYFYRFIASYYSSKILAFTGCILLLGCFPYQIYNTFLYTESIFFSLTIIYSCYLVKIEKLTPKIILQLLLFIILLCITRPNGIFFLGATIIYLYFFVAQKINLFLKVGIFFLVSAIGLFILNYLMGSGGAIDIILPFKDERVICDVPTLPFNANIDTLPNGNSLSGLFYYITHNFNQFSRLAILKTKAFFGLTRPYYSFGHNLFLIAYFYSFYVCIISIIFKKTKKLPIGFIYFISIIIIYWLSVVFSCDEWHNRFFLNLTPFFIILALFLFKNKNSNLPHDAQ